MSSVPPESILELDQEDMAARLQADSYFIAGIPVLIQRRGITESDVQIKISTANSQNGKIGSVAIVLMPTLTGDAPNSPGPRYWVTYPIQVIDWPSVRRSSPGGSGDSAEEICDRIRQIIHGISFRPGNSISFSSLKPVDVKDGQISYILYFKRLGFDKPPVDCAAVGISPASGTGPLTVTLTCQTAGAAIYYTVDGTYPSSVNPTSQLYSGPFVAPQGSTVRAAASLSGYQQSKVISQVTYN